MKSLLALKRTLAEKNTAHQHLLLLLDYDGTLTPIVSTPGQAKLKAQTRKTVKRLVARSRITVGIISGRALVNVRQMVKLPGIIYAGNHGLELRGRGITFIHPKARAAKPALLKLAHKLRGRLARVPGATVENKTLTLSIHYRNVPKRLWKSVTATILELTRSLRRKKKVKLTCGKCVTEIRPFTNWGKGACVGMIYDRMKRRWGKLLFVMYIGDDRTDEDAFRAVNRREGISALVSSTKRPSKASYRLLSTTQVASCLKYLATL